MLRALALSSFLVVALGLSACVTDGAQPIDREEAARANTELGLAYLQQGKIQRAEVTLKRALELSRNMAEAHVGLGLIDMQRGDLEDAGRHYRRALAVQPDNPYTQNQYGVLLCRQGDYDESMVLLASVVDNNRYRTPEVAATNAGICAQTAGDWLNARRWLNRALQINSRHGAAVLELVSLNLKTDDVAAASQLIDEYSEQNPRNKMALELGLEAASRSGNTWAAERYASKLRNLAKQQPASDGKPE